MTVNASHIDNYRGNGPDRDNGGYIYGVAEAIVQATVLIFIVVFGVIGNLYCVRVICKNRKLRNPTFIFLCNLALSNMIALLLCSPFPLVASIHRRNVLAPFWCRASGFLNNLFFCASIITHSLIAAQKYFTVVRQTKWRALRINRTKARCLVACVWVVCSVLSFVVLGPFENWNYVVFNKTTAHCGISFPRNVSERLRLGALALAAFVVPILIMSYAYTRIYRKVRAHERRAQCRPTRANISAKLAVTLGLMFGTFVFCWLPFFLLIVFSICFEDASELPWSLGRLAYWSGYLNCCINPALYCLRSSAFREALRSRSFGKRRDSLRRASKALKESGKLQTLSPSLVVGHSRAISAEKKPRLWSTWRITNKRRNLPESRRRVHALSFSSGYDLTKVSKTDESFRENFVFLEDGVHKQQHLSSFGAQHTAQSLKYIAESSDAAGSSAHRPAVRHCYGSAKSSSDNCDALQSVEQHIERG